MPADEIFRGKHLRVDLVDPDKLVEVNNLREITNPVFFVRNGVPSPDGLLSNEIFGITKYDRANTFAYIDLYETFINPLIYKMWCKSDSGIKDCVHGIRRFTITDNGELKEDPNGETGIKFLIKNIDKFKLKRTSSKRRDMQVNFLEKYMGTPQMLIKKFIVCPAFYRDVNNDKGKVAIGAINELYRNLIVFVKALRESADYGLNLSDATRGRIQETLTQIYDWFGSGTTINGEKTSEVIPGNLGVLRMSVMSKTTDYASRLVLSAPELKVEKLDDIEADLDYSVLPLASACVNFLPFIMYHVRRFFENEFSGDSVIPTMDKDNTIKYLHPKDYQIEFSDERIKKEIDRFCTGFSNRFIPIEVPTIEGRVVRLRFKGRDVSAEDFANKADLSKYPIQDRDLTWCDVLYMAAVEATADKHILITRYPIDSYFNQYPTRIRIASTNKTTPMVVGNKYYKNYPYITQADIGSNTSNSFIDTLNISNLYLDGIGGDYDGDQVTVKGVYSEEANAELDKQLSSKSHLFNLGGKGVRTSDKEAMQSLYNLTLCLPEDESKMSNPSF